MCHLALKHCKHVVLVLNILLILNTGEQPSDSEVQLLLDEVEKYTLASHLLWGLWGIVSVYLLCIAYSLQQSVVTIKRDITITRNPMSIYKQYAEFGR